MDNAGVELNAEQLDTPRSILLHFYDINDNELPKLTESFEISCPLHVIFTHISIHQCELTSNNASNLIIKPRSNPNNKNTLQQQFNQNSSLTLIQAIQKSISYQNSKIDLSNINSFDFIISINNTNITSNPNPITIPTTINNHPPDDDNHTPYTLNDNEDKYKDKNHNKSTIHMLPDIETYFNFIPHLTPIPEANGCGSSTFDFLTQQMHDIDIDPNDLPPDVSEHHAHIDLPPSIDPKSEQQPLPTPLPTSLPTETETESHPQPQPQPQPLPLPLPLPIAEDPISLSLPALDTNMPETERQPQRDQQPEPDQEPEEEDNYILSRQYVHTVHQLMGKDIIIPAPAIPYNWDIMQPSPFEHNFTPNDDNQQEQDANGDPDRDRYPIGVRVNFGDKDDAEMDPDLNEDMNENEKSYYYQIREMNKEANNQYHELLKIYPKRILNTDPENCHIWTNLSVRSLSSHLQSKKVEFCRTKTSIYHVITLIVILGPKTTRS